jgi:hypothetical protein
MKKYLPALCLLAVLSSAPARAEKYQPYLGLDIQYHMFSYDSINNIDIGNVLDDSAIAANFHAGTRFGDYFGLELGYEKYHDAPRADVLGTNENTSLARHGMVIDGYGYYPLSASGMLEGIATVGVGWIWNEISVRPGPLGLGTWGDNDSEWDLRFGGGLQYQLGDKYNIRALLRYQTLSLEGGGSGEYVAMAGFNYLLGKR